MVKISEKYIQLHGKKIYRNPPEEPSKLEKNPFRKKLYTDLSQYSYKPSADYINEVRFYICEILPFFSLININISYKFFYQKNKKKRKIVAKIWQFPK